MKKLTLIILAVWLTILPATISAIAQEKENDKVQKEEIYIPKDLADCFSELNKMLKKEDIDKIKLGEIKPIDMHFGLGMGLRNFWRLWGGSRLAKYFNKMGIYHPDDMSGSILDSYARNIRGEPIKLEEQINYYQEYWKKVKKQE